MTKVQKKITVAVTGLNAIDSPGPGVAVIRAIRDSKDYKVRIIGLSYEAMEPGIYIAEEGIGIRLENDVLIGETENIDLLGDVPLLPDDIERLMAR